MTVFAQATQTILLPAVLPPPLQKPRLPHRTIDDAFTLVA